MSQVSVVSKEGQTLTTSGSARVTGLLAIPDSGEVMEVFSENIKKGIKLISEEAAKEATITLKIKLKPCKSDSQLFDVEATSTVTAPARKYLGATFFNKDFDPSVNRDDASKFIYHSRG